MGLIEKDGYAWPSKDIKSCFRRTCRSPETCIITIAFAAVFKDILIDRCTVEPQNRARPDCIVEQMSLTAVVRIETITN